MPVGVVGTGDGPRLTVSQVVKQPLSIRARVLQLTENRFLGDALLRNAGSNAAGAVTYEESTPLFATDDAEIVEEFGEIPATVGQRGIPKVVRSTRRGLAVKISEDMRRRNAMDELNRQLTQVTNTMIRAWDRAFFSALLDNPNVQTDAVTTAWATSTTIRQDINNAKRMVEEAQAGAQTTDYLGFQPDTLVLGTDSKYDLLNSDAFNSLYEKGDLASEDLRYTGKLPRKLLDLDVVTTRDPLLSGKAIVLERGTVGFISDERPLRTTPLYEDRPRETWRADVTRISAVGVDQPLAAVVLTGL